MALYKIFKFKPAITVEVETNSLDWAQKELTRLIANCSDEGETYVIYEKVK